MSKDITKEDIQLTIDFLKTRTIDVRKNKNLKHLTEIISYGELFSILEILKAGKMGKFIKENDKTRKRLYKIANLK